MDSQSLLLVAPQRLEWRSETLPPLQPHEVLIKTRAGAISIGTEMACYAGNERSSTPVHYPYMTGYESLGTVIETGSKVHTLLPGNRVVAFYGHRTYGIAPAAKVIVIPDEITDEQGLLAILTCDVFKGIQKLKPREDEPILITGAGTIGLLSVFMLKAMGMRSIDIVEPLAERRRLALHLGALHAFIPEQMTEQEEAHYNQAIECSSRNAAFALLQKHLGHNGRICILSDGNYEPLELTPAFHEKELTITGSNDGLDYQKHARRFFTYLGEHSTRLEELFTHYIDAKNLDVTFEQIASGSINPIKVFVSYPQTQTQQKFASAGSGNLLYNILAQEIPDEYGA